MMRTKRIALLALSCSACDAALDQRLAIIDRTRVLAVIAEPAEARPGAPVTYTAVVAAPDGPVTAGPAWAFCVAPKPPSEDNAVSDACLTPAAHLVALGTQPAVTAALPAEGCLDFGPETPPGNFRPRDADASGGFYQPIRADVAGEVAFGLSRITCKLATAPGPVAHDYDLRYVANANPTLDPLALPRVPPDTDVSLTASWPASAAETYLYYDPRSQTLVTRREAMRLSWFATGGRLTVDASAVGETDPATTVSTTWHTPAAGPATLWLVLRDSRGGIASQTVAIDVAP
ncbi:MAG TPA: hypothetical protein VF469_07805 [Kofleriaceae bacterium]